MESHDYIHGQELPTEEHQEESIAGEGVLDHRLSLLHLDHCPMAPTPLKRPSSTPSGNSPYGALISSGYSVLQLSSANAPPTSPLQNGPPLCRCSNSNLGLPAEFLNRPREDPARRSLFASPIKAHPLARSSSDPVTLSQFQNPRNTPSPAQESPSSKRRKRMDCARKMKQMKKLVDKFVQEHETCSSIPTHKVLDGDKANDDFEESAYEEGKNEEGERENGGAEEDTVSAKRVGECTQLNFKCPCGCGFKVFLVGQSCFYKRI